MKLDVVGQAEIAEMAGANRSTVRGWQRRRLLPTPDAQLMCGPIWRRSRIERWLRDNGETRLGAK